MSTNKLFFPALTGYRAVVAWMIFVYHFMPFNNPKYPMFLKQSISNFHIGVEMFFVLSGFLITYRYFNDYPIHFKKYMVNRFARIYPMYILLTIAGFLIWYLQNDFWDKEKSIELLLSATMTKALFAKYNLAGIPQGWTLTLEEIFYITAPVFFIIIRKSKWTVLILPILILIFGIGLKHLTNVSDNQWGFMQNNISVYIFDFFAGIAMGIFILKKDIQFKRPWVTWFGLLTITLYIFGKHYASNFIDFKSDLGRAMEIAFLAVFGIAPLLWGLIYEKTILRTILSKPVFVLLGKSSYIFYLIHKGFLPILINDYIIDNKLVIFIFLNIASVILYLYIEEPLNHSIRKKFGRNKASMQNQ